MAIKINLIKGIPTSRDYKKLEQEMQKAKKFRTISALTLLIGGSIIFGSNYSYEQPKAKEYEETSALTTRLIKDIETNEYIFRDIEVDDPEKARKILQRYHDENEQVLEDIKKERKIKIFPYFASGIAIEIIGLAGLAFYDIKRTKLKRRILNYSSTRRSTNIWQEWKRHRN